MTAADDDTEEALVVVVVALGMGGFKGPFCQSSVVTLKSRNSTLARPHSTLLVGQPEVVSPLTRSLAQRSTLKEEREEWEKETEKRMAGWLVASCNRKWRSRRERGEGCKSQSD